MKDEPRPTPKHQLEHAVPTVIHHPEADMPVLARWLDRAMADRTRFWTLVGGSVAAVLVLVVIANGISLGHTNETEAWTKLETARTPAERVEIAREYPKTPAEQWALLQAATEYYNQGFAQLPENRDVGLPNLKKALDYFEEVAREAPAKSPQARAAALGVARTLEARNELKKAIAQYEKVAKNWPGTDEAKEAEHLGKELALPESAAFYEKLYAYKPKEVTLPPMGKETLDLPPGHPPIGGGASAIPSPLLLPPPPSMPPSTKPKTESGLPGLPAEVFAPGGPGSGSTPEMPKTNSDEPPPKPEPAPAPPQPERPKGELPDNVFSPK